MKQIKQLVLVLITLFSTGLFSIVKMPGTVNAQTQPELFVAVTPYHPLQKLDFFFTHSVHPLIYLEGNGITPVFISIITPLQKEAYLQAGYQPVIVDEHAGDIQQYYVVSTRRGKPNQLQQLLNPALQQQGVALAYPLSPQATLIKLTKGMTYGQLHTPFTASFRAFRFNWNLVPPIDRTSSAMRVTPAPTSMNQPAENSGILQAIMFGILLLVIIFPCFFFLTRKRTSKKKRKNTGKSDKNV